MKITPDSSLFTALSNVPNPADGRKRAPQNQGQDAGSKDDLIRRALADGNLRQQAVKLAQSKRASETGVARATSETVAAQRGSVTREVPFAATGADAGTKPPFKRLGQLVDLRV